MVGLRLLNMLKTRWVLKLYGLCRKAGYASRSSPRQPPIEANLGYHLILLNEGYPPNSSSPPPPDNQTLIPRSLAYKETKKVLNPSTVGWSEIAKKSSRRWANSSFDEVHDVTLHRTGGPSQKPNQTLNSKSLENLAREQ